MARQKIKEAVRLRVIQRDGLYCRYCGYGPMRIYWRRDRHGRVRLRVGTDGADLGTMLNLDHRKPASLGGSSTAGNLVVSCARCNMRKGTKRRRARLLDPQPISIVPPSRFEGLS
ncbi:MAG: HNH endonuclease [Solirubrobacterales bacterium]|nr:HNH endonuclease [Solirubrobacterales bacterium]